VFVKKGPKPKAVNYEIIPDSAQSEPHKLLRKIQGKFHRDLDEAKIALAWRKALKPDVDGRLVLGRCVKASDLQRELVRWDFVILLNREVWQLPDFTADKKEALIDHELCHAAVALDADGEPKIDEKNRQVWRVRKHDIEEFGDVVERHGLYKRDLERFAESLLKSRQGALALKGTAA
jgi:hypothetical protein